MNGVKFSAPSIDGEFAIKGVCTLFVYDLPAASKSLGFSFFNSHFACRHCDHSFPRLPNNPLKSDFSNLNVDAISQGTKETNTIYAQQFKALNTQTARQEHVKLHGTR